jgi:hypothetical protein
LKAFHVVVSLFSFTSCLIHVFGFLYFWSPLFFLVSSVISSSFMFCWASQKSWLIHPW